MATRFEPMAKSQTTAAIRQLLATLERHEVGASDADLLNRFLKQRDDSALGALVRRHSAMVWGVCRRILRSHHDAEDAFQATFLVLVRKAATIRDKELVANWLYGVAHQTAVRLRAAAAKRAGRERQAANVPEPVLAEDRGEDLLPLLDQELSRLPEPFRVLIVLCDLEGLTRKEAARRLGCPEGTVASRLARARALLAKRMGRHGLATSGAVLAGVLARSTAAPAAAVAATIKAATLSAAGQAVGSGLISARVSALVEGVVKTMFVTKLKSALTAALVVGLAFGGAGAGIGLFSNPAAAHPVEGKRPAHAEEKPTPQEREMTTALLAAKRAAHAEEQPTPDEAKTPADKLSSADKQSGIAHQVQADSRRLADELSATDKQSGIAVELVQGDLLAKAAQGKWLWKWDKVMEKRGVAQSLTIKDGEVHILHGPAVLRIDLRTGLILSDGEEKTEKTNDPRVKKGDGK